MEEKLITENSTAMQQSVKKLINLVYSSIAVVLKRGARLQGGVNKFSGVYRHLVIVQH